MGPGGTTTSDDASDTVMVAGIRVRADSVFARLDADLADLTHGPLRPTDAATAADLTRVLESFGRRLRGAQLLVMDQIDQASLHRADGHSTISIHTRHNTDSSNAEALNRTKTMRMMRGLPLIGAAVLDGSLSMDKAELLARIYANPRVAPSMADRQETFLAQADSMPFHAFEVRVRSWERMMDFDGSEPPNERTHRNRTAKLAQDQIDLSWEFVAKFAAMQGAQINEIWGHYLDAEWQADWEKAVAEHGDKASVADMPRTHAQRAADALWQIFQDAAGADGSAVPPGFVHNIEWSEHTYQEMLRRLDGQDPQPLDPDQHCCQTIDGVPLEPTEAAANSLLNAVRRVIVDAASMTLDMGRKRFFTGPLRDAINLASDGTCVWPGCCTPVSKCEADHLEPYGEDGLTNPRVRVSSPKANSVSERSERRRHCVGNTTDGNRKGSPSNDTPREPGPPHAPTAPPSNNPTHPTTHSAGAGPNGPTPARVDGQSGRDQALEVRAKDAARSRQPSASPPPCARAQLASRP